MTYSAPAVSTIPAVKQLPVVTTEEAFPLPSINENFEIPLGTPASGIMASLDVPLPTPNTQIDIDDLYEPPKTDIVE